MIRTLILTSLLWSLCAQAQTCVTMRTVHLDWSPCGAAIKDTSAYARYMGVTQFDEVRMQYPLRRRVRVIRWAASDTVRCPRVLYMVEGEGAGVGCQ